MFTLTSILSSKGEEALYVIVVHLSARGSEIVSKWASISSIIEGTTNSYLTSLCTI